MSRWPKTSLRGHIVESSVRKGEAPAEILSVTNSNGFVRSREIFDKQVFSEDASNYKLVRFNELAYNPSRINVGSVARCELRDGGAISPMYVVVRCRETLLPEFLLYFLKSSIGLQHIAHRAVGAVRFMLRFSDLEQIELPLPPPPEQARIVGILREAEAIHKLSFSAAERALQTTAALFQQLFGKPPRTSSTWRPTTLGKLGTVVTGNTPPRTDPSFYGDAIEWVKTDNIDARRCTVSPSLERLSEAGAMRGRIVPKGSVLITCIAGSIERIGDAAITSRKVAINQQINAIIPNEGVSSAFLGALVSSLKPLIQARATGVMTRIINKSMLEGIPAISPPEALQQRFQDRVTEIRQLEAAQAVRRGRTDELFQSLLYRAFRGEL